MIKNTKNTKFLIPVVIIIWGMLIYKFIDGLSPDEIALTKPIKTTFKTPVSKEKESFDLLTIESDPFLGTIYKKTIKKKTDSNKKKKKIDIVWPTIKYDGIVSDTDSNTSIFMLNINGRQYLVKKGDTLQQIKVLKSTAQSIRLKFKNQTKEFEIN